MISLFKVLMTEQAKKNALAALSSGYVAQGPKVDEFEKELEFYIGKKPVTVNSGTSALTLALHLAGVKPGDSVLVPPMTCIATTLPIIHAKAFPIWVDVDPLTGLIDPADVAKKITRNTKAIMAIDWGGYPCDYERLRGIVEAAGRTREDLPIIQDAAHSFGANFDPGTDNAGDYICWSFQAIKTLSTCDGGALITPIKDYERAKKLRWFGFDRTSKEDFRSAQKIDDPGFKFHMNDLAAAIGLGNLAGDGENGLPSAIEAVGMAVGNAYYYQDRLNNLVGDKLLAIPSHPDAAMSSWWLYTILVDERDKFVQFMGRRGIQVSQVHTRNDSHPVFQRITGTKHTLPGLDYFAAHQVSIPVGWWLTKNDQEVIVNAIEDWATR